MTKEKLRILILAGAMTVAVSALFCCSTTPDNLQSGKPAVEARLDRTLKSLVDNKKVFGISFCITSGDGSFSWNGGAGVMDAGTQYPIASITKMFTGAVIMKLREEGRIGLDDKISLYLSKNYIERIHVLEGVDYSGELTIRQLLSHTSGLPDYFTERRGKEASFEDIRKERDMEYNIEDILGYTRALKPHFKPGTKDKAWYADTNYQLLGVIIERVTGKPLEKVYLEHIFLPLKLQHTYLQRNNMKAKMAPFYYKGKPQVRPHFVASERSTGGVVSTAPDMMIFIRAYFSGKLFPKEYLSEMKGWKSIQFFPVQYGTNLMRINMPGMPAGELIGHSGSTGTVAYYCPKKDIYITGATGQLDTFTSIIVTMRLLTCVDGRRQR